MRPLLVISPLQRAAVVTLAAALVLGLAAFVAQITLHLGGAAGQRLFGVYGTNALVTGAGLLVLLRGLLVERQRLGWLVLGAGALLWAAGGWWWALVLAGSDDPPFPSVSDGLFLAFYPCAYVAVLLLGRGQLERAYRSMWLDGLVGTLTVAAITGALFVQPITAGQTGDLAAVLTNLAYPVGDGLLLAFVVMVFALLGWRPGRTWTLFALGLATLALVDSIYLLQVARDTYQVGTLIDPLWPFAMLLLAATAWQPPRERSPVQLSAPVVLVMPLVFALGAAGLLLYGNHAEIAGPAQVLAALAIVLALGRTAMTFREVQALADSRRQAMTDELTGLGNRRFLFGELEPILAEARLTETRAAVLVVDLDGFKELNDTLGHVAGDQLLSEIGPRLERAVPASAVVARLGGDEFAVILRDAGGPAAAVARGEELRDAIGERFRYEGLELHVGASVGIAIFPEDGANRDELLQRADVAMYQAKARHSGVQLYSSTSDDHSRERLALMSDLRGALTQDELVLHFQPKAALASGEVTGVEALVRWQHPVRGLLGPHAFLPLAEQLGLMGPLTRVVLRKAVHECAAWRAAGVELPVAVNLSAANLLDLELPELVAATLAQHGLPAHLLLLEITEDTLMVDPDRAVGIIERVRALGVRFALDDFGTGYSSLAYLKRLSVDELKIDRSFVMSLGDDDGDAIIVRSTIDLARNLGLRTVAEGVEDEVTWRRLREFGCDLAQGYFLARPLPAEAVTGWLDSHRSTQLLLDAVAGADLPPAGADGLHGVGTPSRR